MLLRKRRYTSGSAMEERKTGGEGAGGAPRPQRHRLPAPVLAGTPTRPRGWGRRGEVLHCRGVVYWQAAAVSRQRTHLLHACLFSNKLGHCSGTDAFCSEAEIKPRPRSWQRMLAHRYAAASACWRRCGSRGRAAGGASWRATTPAPRSLSVPTGCCQACRKKVSSCQGETVCDAAADGPCTILLVSTTSCLRQPMPSPQSHQ